MKLLLEILICFLAGAGAGIGTGFAGMSAAAVIGPMLVAFLGVPAYEAVGQGFMPVYERQEITDDLHETCGFRTDYQFITKRKMKGIQKKSKRR